MMKTETIILILTTFSTGLMAGIFFTWSNAVTPGIGKLTDFEYLNALQAMNKDILNPTFKLVFIGAIITVALLPILYFKTEPNYIFWLFMAAFTIYWLGVFAITIFGNIPLNELLDQTKLEQISMEEAKDLRKTIELKWNQFNLVRLIASVLTFVIVLLSLLFINK